MLVLTPFSYRHTEMPHAGTAVGDPIEVTSCAGVFAASGDRVIPIGSVKSNIGSVLILRHRLHAAHGLTVTSSRVHF